MTLEFSPDRAIAWMRSFVAIHPDTADPEVNSVRIRLWHMDCGVAE